MSNLRVGYIINDSRQSDIIYDLIQKSKQAQYYSIELLIVQKTLSNEAKGLFSKILVYIKNHGLRKYLQEIFFVIIQKIEYFIVIKKSKFVSCFHSYALEDLSIPKLYVNPLVSKSGFVYRYSEQDLQKIAQENLDVLIRGGSGILRGEILTLCKFGVISFHHANNDVNRGGPAAFWEVFNHEPATGFVIQRLLEELDGGDVLLKGSIATSPVFLLNFVKLNLKANIFLHKLLEDLGKNRKLPKPYIKKPYAHPLYKTPDLFQQVSYLARIIKLFASQYLAKMRGKVNRWGVAYQFVESWQSAVLWRSKIIKNPPCRFLADPFVFYKNGRHVCFVEDYNYLTSRGKITAFQIDANGYLELGTALEEPFHLSYPFLFEADGELFMCPETHEIKDIRIYKCIDFPLKWSLHKILMPGVHAVDTNIFKAKNKWWMLTSLDSSDLMDSYGSELHLFYADTYDATNWQSHPLNPIIFDSLRARNGGLIIEDNDIYRVFQTQGFGSSSESMGIMRIVDLTINNYAEELVATIPAKFFNDIDGTHTYSFCHGLLALDFVKFESYKN